MRVILTLASQSPRRRELLTQLGVALDVKPARTDESARAGEDPATYVLRVARDKARAIEGETVLAADTAVVLDRAILGKPRDDAEARSMLLSLAGRSHEVMTGVFARRGGREEGLVVTSAVAFAPVTEAEVAWYVGTGEPRDKAGAYALQGAGGAFVREVRGSVSNVVGLPLAETLGLLARLGFALPWQPRAAP
jgi:septum formation protein